MEKQTFRSELEAALANLRDVVALRTMALCDLVTTDASRKEQSWELARYLLDAIEQIRPASEDAADSWPRRRYDVLALRYVNGLNPDEVAERMGVSRRHFYRQLQRALDELADYLWPGLPNAKGATESTPRNLTEQESDAYSLLRQESARLLCSRQGASLEQVLQSVLQVLSPLMEERRIAFHHVSPRGLPNVSVSPVVLKQLLLGLFGEILRSGQAGEITVAVQVLDDGVRLTIEGKGAPGTTQEVRKNEVGAQGEANYIDLAGFEGVRIERLDSDSGYAVTLAPEVDRSVLVVDDNEEVCLLLRRYLLSGGYKPREVTTGEEAIAFARDNDLYAITLDLMMSNEDGWDVLQTLTHDPQTSHVPIVVCSVLDQEQLALMLGARVFLKKPVRREQLLHALARLRAPLDSPQ